MDYTKTDNIGKKYLLVFTLAALTCTLIQFNVPLFHRDWILLLFSAFILLSNGVTPMHMKGKVYFYIYACVLLLNFLIGDKYFSSFPRVVCEIVILYVSVSFFDLTNTCNLKTQGILLVTFVCALVVTAIGTYIAEQLSPGILRIVQADILNGRESTTLYEFSKIGMTNYALPHALPIILPLCILIMKEKKLPILVVVFNIIAFICSLAIIYYSGATTPVLLSFVAILISIFIKVENIRKNIARLILLFFIILLLIFSKEYLAHFFQYISEQISITGGSHSLIERFNELSEFILTGNTGEDLEGRMDHYNSTTSIINSNIFLGVNDDSYGGHSALLDRIAVLGLIGFIPLFCFLGIQVKSFFYYLFPKYRTTYLVCICVALMTILTKNMFSREFCIITFLIVPLCLNFLQKIKN